MTDASDEPNPPETPPSPGPYPGGSVAPIPHVPPNDVYAVWALVLGIVGVLCCGFLTGIPAVLLANTSKRRIAASNGEMKGDGLAQAGFVLGIVAIALSVLGALVGLLIAFLGR